MTLTAEIMNIPCRLKDSDFASTTDRLNYKTGHRDARGELISMTYYADAKTLTDAHNASIRSLAAPVAADTSAEGATEQARDAARYRWLRQDDTDVGNVIDKEFKPGYWEYKSGAELDAAIDAAMGLAPLATPADAGATDEDLTAIYNECAIKADDWSERQAREPSNIEAKGYFMRLLLARLSTSPAPVTAEPVAYLHQVVCGDGEPDQALSFAPDNFPLAGTLGYRSLSHQPLYTAPAPARQAFSLQTRDAIRDAALEEAASVYMVGEVAAREIRKLKSMERAADAAETRDAEGGA